MPVICLVNCSDMDSGLTAWATEISGSDVIQKRLGYMQYNAHTLSHLSNQNDVSVPLPNILFMPRSTMCLMDMILDQKCEVC